MVYNLSNINAYGIESHHVNCNEAVIKYATELDKKSHNEYNAFFLNRVIKHADYERTDRNIAKYQEYCPGLSIVFGAIHLRHMWHYKGSNKGNHNLRIAFALAGLGFVNGFIDVAATYQMRQKVKKL